MLIDFLTSFLLGLLTPLTAVCVLPLYPGFLSYLSSKVTAESPRKIFITLGLIVVTGVIIFMLLLGLLFTTILEKSLTNVIEIVSPIAFIILGFISILLIFNFNFARIFPKVHAPVIKNPFWSAFVFGFFFGAIVIPCNPGFIAAFFTRSILVTSFFSNIINFLLFGFGIGFPLLVFAFLSAQWSTQIINFLTRQARKINLAAGIIMLLISLYYIFFVFRFFG